MDKALALADAFDRQTAHLRKRHEEPQKRTSILPKEQFGRDLQSASRGRGQVHAVRDHSSLNVTRAKLRMDKEAASALSEEDVEEPSLSDSDDDWRNYDPYEWEYEYYRQHAYEERLSLTALPAVANFDDLVPDPVQLRLSQRILALDCVQTDAVSRFGHWKADTYTAEAELQRKKAVLRRKIFLQFQERLDADPAFQFRHSFSAVSHEPFATASILWTVFTGALKFLPQKADRMALRLTCKETFAVVEAVEGSVEVAPPSHSTEQPVSFLSLPDDILLEIALHLDMPSLVGGLASTCKQLFRFIHRGIDWRALALTRERVSFGGVQHQSWMLAVLEARSRVTVDNIEPTLLPTERAVLLYDPYTNNPLMASWLHVSSDGSGYGYVEPLESTSFAYESRYELCELCHLRRASHVYVGETIDTATEVSPCPCGHIKLGQNPYWIELYKRAKPGLTAHEFWVRMALRQFSPLH